MTVPSQLNGSHVAKAEVNYWATSRQNDPSEAMSIVNGTCPDVRSYETYIQDMRPNIAKFSLDQNGFEVVKQSSALLPPQCPDFDFSDLKAVTSEYWPEICALVKSKLNARSVLPLASAVRISTSQPHIHPNDRLLSKATLIPAKPFHIVHNDYSPAGSRTVLRAMLSTFVEDNQCMDWTSSKERELFFELRDEIIASEEDAIKLSSSFDHLEWSGSNYTGPRWAIFSIWRPLEAVQSDPLAMLDPRSLFRSSDLLAEIDTSFKPIRLPHKNRPGFVQEYEITNMMPLHPAVSKREHKWYWLSDQQPDEVHFLKLFDSEGWVDKRSDGDWTAPCAAHSAFELEAHEDKPPRRSIETRIIVVW